MTKLLKIIALGIALGVCALLLKTSLKQEVREIPSDPEQIKKDAWVTGCTRKSVSEYQAYMAQKNIEGYIGDEIEMVEKSMNQNCKCILSQLLSSDLTMDSFQAKFENIDINTSSEMKKANDYCLEKINNDYSAGNYYNKN